MPTTIGKCNLFRIKHINLLEALCLPLIKKCCQIAAFATSQVEGLFFGKKIIFSYEVHFDLGGYANKQNCRIWDTVNPYPYAYAYIHTFGADFGPEA